MFVLPRLLVYYLLHSVLVRLSYFPHGYRSNVDARNDGSMYMYTTEEKLAGLNRYQNTHFIPAQSPSGINLVLPLMCGASLIEGEEGGGCRFLHLHIPTCYSHCNSPSSQINIPESGCRYTRYATIEGRAILVNAEKGIVRRLGMGEGGLLREKVKHLFLIFFLLWNLLFC